MAKRMPQHPISYRALVRIPKVPVIGDSLKGVVTNDMLGELPDESLITLNRVTQLWGISHYRYLVQVGTDTFMCRVVDKPNS